MRALGALIVGAAVMAAPAASDSTSSNSAREWTVDNRVAVFSSLPIAQAPPLRRHGVRGSYGPDPTVLAMIHRIADESGIPRETMLFHVKHESGFRPDAKNRRSTATGFLQLIRGSHAAIIGRALTKAEHAVLARKPEHNLRVGAAHIRACMELMPGASAVQLWKRCHIRGHAAVGGRIEMAARFYRPDSQGWLARGSVAMPWSQQERG
jgi:hypothetical protein